MNIGLCIRIVGLLLMLFSLGTLPSMVLGWVQEDGTAEVFGQAFAATHFRCCFIVANSAVNTSADPRWLFSNRCFLDRPQSLWVSAISAQ